MTDSGASPDTQTASAGHVPALVTRGGGEPVDVPSPVPSPSSPPFNEGAAIGEQLTHPQPRRADERPRVGASYILLIVLAQFGAFMALVAPIGYSLSVSIDRLAPDNREFLGYVTGVGALVVVLVGPILGMLSDRTRSRLGRRRPWIIWLTLIGLLGLTVVGIAPNVAVLILGWAITQLGFGVAGLIIAASMGDRLPESQRGKVAGLTGAATMLASIFGVAIAGMLASNSLLLFLVPGGIGALLMLLFVAFVKEPDTRQAAQQKVSFKSVLGGYVYDVRKYADFSWNWLGRFLFNFGLTLATTFTTFLFAVKLGLPVDQLGGIIAISGLLGILGLVGGALLSGFLSDRLKRRKAFIIFSAAIFLAGGIVTALAPDLPMLLVGGLIMNVGLGVFSAVDQALYLDVLPESDTQAGRFIAINQFSTSIPQFAAPLIAPLFLAIGVTSGEGNYPLLYVLAGAFAVIGGLVILLKVKSVR